MKDGILVCLNECVQNTVSIPMSLPPLPQRKNVQELIREVQDLLLIHQVVSDFRGRLVDVHELSEE